MTISGRYRDFVEYENPVLGLLSSSTGISTKAARFRVAAGDRQLVSFGTRRVHPALAPLVERSCYMAGFDGVSNVLGGKLLGSRAFRHDAARAGAGDRRPGAGVEAL